MPGGKGGVDTHKLWKHVLPRSTEFAWPPCVLAEAFCLPALQVDPNRQYGTLAQCVPSQTPKSMITVDQIYFIGDSRSASELEVFIDMPIKVEGRVWSPMHPPTCSACPQQQVAPVLSCSETFEVCNGL